MIDVLKAEIELIDAQLKLLRTQRQEKQERLNKLTWVPIEWDDLRELLLKEYPKNNYRKNPMVCNYPGGRTSYCFIADDGCLQIGAYYHNDRFKRGESLFIHHARKSWN